MFKESDPNQSLIIWVDSDPNVRLSANPLRELGCELQFLMKLKIVLIISEE